MSSALISETRSESHASRLQTFFMQPTHPHLSSFHIELHKDKMVYFQTPARIYWPRIYTDQYVSVYLGPYLVMVAPLNSDVIPYWPNGFEKYIYTCSILQDVNDGENDHVCVIRYKFDFYEI